ncbi:MAG: Phage integrase, N-terminal SAM-like domain [Firmicutes bacterium]|nr:Phage integrase, N-terminal SAM-like domain [Bacillota bacterium]
MELGQAKKIFLITKKSENVTSATLETYNIVLRKFLEYLIERDIFEINSVDSLCIREFFVTLKDKGIKGVV